VDSSGNIYVTGYTGGSFDGNTHSGATDFFVLKYDGSGTKQWIQQFGTTTDEGGFDIFTGSKSIYASGYSYGSLSGSNQGNWDTVVVEYNDRGIQQEVQQIGTSSRDAGESLTVDSSGNIYVTGKSGGAFDGNTSSGSSDMILIKYNNKFQKQWSRQLGGPNDDYGNGIAADSLGNVYVAGGSGDGFDGYTVSGGGYIRDVFITKYNADGTKQWTEQFGSDSDDTTGGIVIDGSNNMYVVGSFNGVLDSESPVGDYDIFIVKYSSDRVKQWTRRLGGTGREMVRDIAIDSSANIYLTGYTNSSLDGNSALGNYDIFVAKYNSNGEKQWTKQIGSSSDDRGYSIAVDDSGSSYITGMAKGGLDGNSNLGGADFFVLKLDSDGNLQ